MTPLAMAEVAPRTRTREGSCLRALATSCDPLPEGGVKCRVDVAREGLPLRIERLELLCGHARVLGGVHAASVILRDACEPVEEVEAYFGANGEIERESDSGRGEGEHAGGWHIAKDFDHSEKRGEAGCGDGFHDFDDAHLLVRFPGKDALELEQAAF